MQQILTIIDSASFSALIALAGVVATLVVQKIDGKLSKRNLIREKQISELLLLLDAVCEVQAALDSFAGSASGRIEPDENSSHEEIEEARERDEEGAEAVKQLGCSMDHLMTQSRRVSAISSRDLLDYPRKLQAIIDDYLKLVAKHMETDRIFVASDYKRANKLLKDEMDNFVMDIRGYLRIDELS